MHVICSFAAATRAILLLPMCLGAYDIPRVSPDRIDDVLDGANPDTCCGPDVGEWTVRQSLIGPQPYLVDPDKFFDIICCLAKERYLPAKNLLAIAESDLAKTESDITRAESDLAQKKGSLEADFKASVISPIDCEKYKRKVHPAPPAA
jgi:hypothetical protein